MTTEERRTNSPQSVMRVIRILEALSVSAGSLSLAELSRALDTPKSSMAALLRGLAEAGFVEPAEGGYRLGPGAFGLGGSLVEARRRLQSPDLVREGMRRLAERTGETVLLAVRDKGADTITYVDAIESRNAVRFSVSVGDRRPLFCTAGGRVLLAAAPEDETRRYLSLLKPQRFTPRTQTDKRRIAEAIALARETGVAQTMDQAAEGVAGAAAVVRDADGRVIGALIVAAPSSRLKDEGAAIARLVLEAAAAISKSLGFRASARN